MEYLVADYYPHFVCKCGDCRSSCCHGWPVTISKSEYLRLREADCEPAYRQKLDGAVNVSGYGADEKSYAHIVHDKFGNCRLLRQDGLCGLQLQLGEAILPDVCRLYPRNVRSAAGVPELACAASCEAVVEKLLGSREPLGFTKLELPAPPRFQIQMTEAQYARTRQAIRILEDRSLPLPERFQRLGAELFDLGGGEVDRAAALRLMHAVLDYYAGKSRVAGPICSEALRVLGVDDRQSLNDWEVEELEARYAQAAAGARQRRPSWDMDLERLLVNHLFYNSFPHVGGTDDGANAFYGLCVTAAFMQLALFACMTLRDTEEDAVDILSELSRLIEHSDFKYRAAAFYRQFSRDKQGVWQALVSF